MLKITPLNYESESEGCENQQFNITKEAQEDQALELYKEALKLQNLRHYDEAYNILLKLLEFNVINEVCSNNSGVTQPLLGLKYSCYKNLAQIALILGKEKEGLEHFLDALTLDPGDVTVWFKAGNLSKKLNNFSMARSAYIGGLQANPHHWPCLHEVITVLYVLSDYFNCLLYISMGLHRDPGYLKGLVFRDQIFKEDHSLKSVMKTVVGSDDYLFTEVDYNFEEHSAIIEEAKSMRALKLQQYSEEELEVKKMSKPDHISLKQLTWESLGTFILDLYSFIDESQLYTPSSPVDMVSITAHSCGESTQQDINEGNKSQASPELPNTQSINNSINQCTELVEMKGNDVVVNEEICDAEQDKAIDIEEDQQLPSLLATLPSEVQDNQEGQEYDQAMELDSNIKRSVKRKKNLAAEFYYFGEVKRRSSRVRSQTVRPTAKLEEETDYALCLLKLIPVSLSQVSCKDCDTDMGSSDTGDTMQYQVRTDSGDCIGHDRKGSEEMEVISFLSQLNHIQSDYSIVNIMNDFIIAVCKLTHKWSKNLKLRYIDIFKTLRKHCPYPSICEVDDINKKSWEDLICNIANTTLTYVELLVGLMKSSSIIIDSFVDDALLYLMEAISSDVWGKDSKEAQIRLFWIEAMLGQHYNNTFIHLRQLKQLQLSFQDESLFTDTSLTFSHDPFGGALTGKVIDQLIDVLERNCNAKRVLELHQEGDYEGVVNSLVPSFYKLRSIDSSDCDVPSRWKQLEIFIHALVQKGDIEGTLKWYQKTLEEAIKLFTSSEVGEIKDRWAWIIQSVVSALECCPVSQCLKSQERQVLGQLCQNMMQIILINLTASETMLVDSFYPWILLHQLIAWEEGNRENADDNTVPSSLQFLVTAHEWIGRRSWCCHKDGQFVLYVMDQLQEHATEVCGGLVPEMLRVGIEQCIYCLYGHPSKKSKVRHLQDHGVNPITLTWERAVTLFKYFRPPELPEYDSYRIVSITPETESLLRKIVALIPESEILTKRRQAIKNYICGKEEAFPDLEPYTASGVVEDIYYLVADYSFKSKDWQRAAEYYELDVSVIPGRVDSWAGLALAQTGKLEMLINSCQSVKNDGSVYDKVASALKCFKRTLHLQPKLTKIWIEYGSFAYMMHSFASRQLKQETLDLTLSMCAIVEEQREYLLEVAHNCFINANKITAEYNPDCEEQGGYYDERWLHHYMLGKIAEKQCQSAHEILTHYEKASKFIHEAGAKYPRKLNYHNPQLLSVEALEIFYRIHAWILKHILKNETSPLPREEEILFNSVLSAVANGPFYDLVPKSGGRDDPEEPAGGPAGDVSATRKRPSSEKLEGQSPVENKKRTIDPSVGQILKELVETVSEKLEAENYKQKRSALEMKIPENPLAPKLERSYSDTNEAECSAPIKGEAGAQDVEIIELVDEAEVMDTGEKRATAVLSQRSNSSPSLPPYLGASSPHCLPGDTETSCSAIAPASPSSPILISEISPLSQLNNSASHSNASNLTSSSPVKDLPVASGKSSDGFLSASPSSVVISPAEASADPEDSAKDSNSKRGFTSDFQKAFENALLSANFDSESEEEMEEEKLPSEDVEEMVVQMGSVGDVSRESSVREDGEEGSKSEKPDMPKSAKSDDSIIEIIVEDDVQETQTVHDSPLVTITKLEGSSPTTQTSVPEEIRPQTSVTITRTSSVSDCSLVPVNVGSLASAPTPGMRLPNTLVTGPVTPGPAPLVGSGGKAVLEENRNSPKKLGYNKDIIEKCLLGLQECLHRFPHHYKSLYRIVHYYYASQYYRNIKWCKDLMLGVASNWTRYKHMVSPGLFFERKKTNFFNGIWRIPSNDVDRPGSFAAHMYRCVALLIDILQDVSDSHTLVNLLIHMDHRPDADKTYLHEAMRMQLVEHGYKVLVRILKQKANLRKTGNSSLLAGVLLDVYKDYQKISKHMPGRPEVGAILESCYTQFMRKMGDMRDKYSLEQAIKHCEKMGSPTAVPPGSNRGIMEPSKSKPRGRPPFQNQMPAFNDLSLLSSIAAAQAQIGKLTPGLPKLDPKKTMNPVAHMGVLPDFTKFLASDLSTFATGYQSDYFKNLYQSMLTGLPKDPYFSDVSVIPVSKHESLSRKGMPKNIPHKSLARAPVSKPVAKSTFSGSSSKVDDTVLVKTGKMTNVIAHASCLPTSIANKIPQSISVIKSKTGLPGSSLTISKSADLSGKPPPAHQSSKKSSFVAFPVSDKPQYPSPPVAHGSSLSSIAKMGKGPLAGTLTKGLDGVTRVEKSGKPPVATAVSVNTTKHLPNKAHMHMMDQRKQDPFKTLKANLSDPKQTLFSNKNISIEIINKDESIYGSSAAKDSSHMLSKSIEMIPLNSKCSKRVSGSSSNAMTITPSGGASQVIELGKTSSFLRSVIGQYDKPGRKSELETNLPGLSIVRAKASDTKTQIRMQRPSVITASHANVIPSFKLPQGQSITIEPALPKASSISKLGPPHKTP